MDKRIEYILAHGSGNKFVMIDAVEHSVECSDIAQFVRTTCSEFGSDGLLFLEMVLGRDKERYLAMDMYNTDGTRAEMCGNGMRLVARLAYSRYLKREEFTLYSGGAPYPIRHADATIVSRFGIDLAAIPNFGVQIAINYATKDFALSSEPFIGKVIEELHPTLKFTYLNLGNPHIVAEVEAGREVDLELLSELGERVKVLKNIFPYGVNVSLLQHLGDQQIFVATYERGVGLTASCGTAMTASSTASALLGLCRWGESIEVRNRGGFVKCVCQKTEDESLTTELIGNATYIEEGVLEYDEQHDRLDVKIEKQHRNEIMAFEVARQD